jgi:hypothetical protein
MPPVRLAAHSATVFTQKWDALLASCLASRLTTWEIDALCDLLTALDASDAAQAWRDYHNDAEAVGQPALDSALHRAVAAWREANDRIALLSCALIAHRVRAVHPTATTLPMEGPYTHDEVLQPYGLWHGPDGKEHDLDDDVRDQISYFVGNLDGDNAGTWHAMCETVDDPTDHYVLRLDAALKAIDPEGQGA